LVGRVANQPTPSPHTDDAREIETRREGGSRTCCDEAGGADAARTEEKWKRKRRRRGMGGRLGDEEQEAIFVAGCAGCKGRGVGFVVRRRIYSRRAEADQCRDAMCDDAVHRCSGGTGVLWICWRIRKITTKSLEITFLVRNFYGFHFSFFIQNIYKKE